MPTDRDALRAAILAQPDDDTPRLAFADMLDEEGEHGWADTIRAEIAAHAAGRVADTWAAMLTRYLKDWYDEDLTEPPNAPEWCSLVPREARGDDTIALGLCPRGFVGGVSCSFAEYRRHAAAWFAKWPVQHVILFDKRPHIWADTGCLPATQRPPGRFAWLSDAVPENDLDSPAVLPREWVRDMTRWNLGRASPDAPGCWFDTVEEACAALSEHCVALGRQAALTGDPP